MARQKAQEYWFSLMIKYLFFAALCESFAAFAVKTKLNRKVREVRRKGTQRKCNSISN
jgi:hypothetical protein